MINAVTIHVGTGNLTAYRILRVLSGVSLRKVTTMKPMRAYREAFSSGHIDSTAPKLSV
jgi:hypothetical protein